MLLLCQSTVGMKPLANILSYAQITTGPQVSHLKLLETDVSSNSDLNFLFLIT